MVHLVTYCDLEYELLVTIRGVERVQDGGEVVGVELDYEARLARYIFPGLQRERHTIDDGTDDLMDLALLRAALGGCEAL